MNTTAIALVLISATVHAVRDMFLKKSSSKFDFLWLWFLMEMVFFAPLFVYMLVVHGYPEQLSFTILIAASVTHFLYSVFLAKAYEVGDLSHAYPIIRSSPALVIVLAYFILDEHISLIGLIGIVCMMLGGFFVNYKKAKGQTATHVTNHKKTVLFATIAMMSLASLLIIDKKGIADTNPIIYIYIVLAIAFMYFTILARPKRSQLKTEWDKSKYSICINAVCGLGGYLLVLYAFTLERVSYVVGLRQISVVFAVVIGGHILREQHKLIRFTGACIIFVGALCIAHG